MARGSYALYFGILARPSELRLARLEDLDLLNLRFFVRHPKGGGSWAKPDWIEIVVEEMEPYIHQYLQDREEYLIGNGIKSHPSLFPNIRGKSGFYSQNSFNKIKRDVEQVSGVEFLIKDFRSSGATLFVRNDPSQLSAVSRQLRHKSPETTNEYYARIDAGSAGQALRESRRKPEVQATIEEDTSKTGPVFKPIDAQKAFIDKKFPPSGYA